MSADVTGQPSPAHILTGSSSGSSNGSSSKEEAKNMSTDVNNNKVLSDSRQTSGKTQNGVFAIFCAGAAGFRDGCDGVVCCAGVLVVVPCRL